MYSYELKNLDSTLINILSIERFTFLSSKKADKVLILYESDKYVADIGLYLNNIPYIDNKKTCYLGTIHSNKKVPLQYIKNLLYLAERYAQENSYEKIITPLDRDTWSSYRVKTSTSLCVPFPGEPTDAYCKIYTMLNYTEAYKYISTLSNLKNKEETEINDITFRLVTNKTIDADIESIYELSTEEFKNNLFYGDINKDQFIQQYLFLFNKLNPIVYVAEKDEKIIGFLMGYSASQCLPDCNCFVMKTVAVKSNFRNIGIGSELYKRVANKASDLGYDKLIGGLIYIDNNSYKITKHYENNKIVSNYILYSKDLNRKEKN